MGTCFVCLIRWFVTLLSAMANPLLVQLRCMTKLFKTTLLFNAYCMQFPHCTMCARQAEIHDTLAKSHMCMLFNGCGYNHKLYTFFQSSQCHPIHCLCIGW